MKTKAKIKRSISKGKQKKIEYSNYLGSRKNSSNFEQMKYSNTVRKREFNATFGKKSSRPHNSNLYSPNKNKSSTSKGKGLKGISYKLLTNLESTNK